MLPRSNPNLSLDVRNSLDQRRVGLGGRSESAARVGQQKSRGRTNPYPGFNDTQRLYAEGDNYGSPFTLAFPESDIPWIQNVDQAGDDITIDSTGPYADFGIRFNSTGLYSVYVRVAMDGDLVGGETGARRVWFLKGEHLPQSYIDNVPHDATWLPGPWINAVPYSLTISEQTFLWWMEADDFTYVGAQTYGETGTVTIVHSVLLVRRIA